MSAKGLAAFIAVLAVLGLLGYGLLSEGDEAVAVGDTAPELELEQLDGAADAGLEQYRGRWVLVNFWSSWCEPCRAESPLLQRFQERHPGRLAVVGVDLEDVRSDALAFVDEFDLSYPQLRARDNQGAIDAFGILARPENFLLDPEGRIAVICRGPVNEASLRDVVEPLLAEREPDASASICRVS
jgi:thiol-disulfide isomerase/thioredoxin